MTHRGPFQPLPFCDSVICFELGSLKFYLIMISYNSWTRQLTSLALSVPLAILLEDHQGIPVEGLTLTASNFTQLKIVGKFLWPLWCLLHMSIWKWALCSFHKIWDVYSECHDPPPKKRQNPRLRGIRKMCISAVLGYLHNPHQKSLADLYCSRINQCTLILSGAHGREPSANADHDKIK